MSNYYPVMGPAGTVYEGGGGGNSHELLVCSLPADKILCANVTMPSGLTLIDKVGTSLNMENNRIYLNAIGYYRVSISLGITISTSSLTETSPDAGVSASISWNPITSFEGPYYEEFPMMFSANYLRRSTPSVLLTRVLVGFYHVTTAGVNGQLLFGQVNNTFPSDLVTIISDANTTYIQKSRVYVEKIG